MLRVVQHPKFEFDRGRIQRQAQLGVGLFQFFVVKEVVVDGGDVAKYEKVVPGHELQI